MKEIKDMKEIKEMKDVEEMKKVINFWPLQGSARFKKVEFMKIMRFHTLSRDLHNRFIKIVKLH